MWSYENENNSSFVFVENIYYLYVACNKFGENKIWIQKKLFQLKSTLSTRFNTWGPDKKELNFARIVLNSGKHSSFSTLIYHRSLVVGSILDW
jgi:hypothetical protein